MSPRGTVEVRAEIAGQLVGPCQVLRSFLWMRRLKVPIKRGGYSLFWVPKWRTYEEADQRGFTYTWQDTAESGQEADRA